MRRLSMGTGYRYLMESIAAGDGRAEQSSGLTRYYVESGTPPGLFLGAGLAGLGGGEGAERGSQVGDEQLYRMLSECVDPLSGEPLGRSPNRQPASLADRTSRRLDRLPADITEAERGAARAKIEAEERARAHRFRPPVAGFDLTFSPSKSVSVAWALADQGTKAVIYECHRRAIDYTLAYAERHVFHSRSGTNGVLQEDIEGVVAASFTHYDSRAGDPQLHDHVVVWNRARSVRDGEWRTLDSRGMYKSVVTLSELHHGVLSDLLTDAFGFGWERQATRNGMAKHEITGVPEALMAEFSRRRAMIEQARDDHVDHFKDAHGRAPSPVELMRLNQQANLETRPDKVHRSLSELTDEWRERAAAYVGDNPVAWVSTLRDRNDLPLLRADDMADGILADAADIASRTVAERHATFSRANVLAEVHRQLHGVCFASPDDRVAVAERTADLALGQAILVTAPELHHTPARFRRPDGSSMLRPADHHLYTTAALLDAETRLLEKGRHTDGPAVTVGTVARISEQNLAGKDYALSVDQALAVERIVTSRRHLDVLVGPAGTGKSTTMAGLAAVWAGEHGPGSVVGLAPSAVAAEVLAGELGVNCENTAKWLHEHRQTSSRRLEADRLHRQLESQPSILHAPRALRERVDRLDRQIDQWELRPDQLVIVDEASLAGTFALDELVTAAREAGAKVLLVGDPYQLSSIEAGGMFRSLVRDRADIVAELTDVRRFTARWEKTASVQLRVGDQTAIDTYDAHARIVEGPRDDLIEAIYTAWKRDVNAGKTSLMIAADSATVGELNRRAQTERIAAGEVSATDLEVADKATVGVGDLVVTRENNRLLATGRRFVKNGDRWTVTATNQDGSMTVRRAGGIGEVVLPADYVRGHVELAYASSPHRSQGRTVDTAHAMVSATTTRDVLYVAATRGRDSNKLYVDTHYDPDPQTGHDGLSEPQTAREVLASVLDRNGGDLGAHDTIRASQDAAESLITLHAEYATLAQAAQEERWESLLERSGLSDIQLVEVRESEAHGPLLAAFRDADARGLDVESIFPMLVHTQTMAGAADVASVLHGRVDRWTEAAGSKRQTATNLIAGLIPRARSVTDEDMAKALNERDKVIETRAVTLAEQAVERNDGWVRRLGRPPTDPTARAAWIHEVRVVAAYRDRWSLSGQTVIGSEHDVATIEQIGHHKRARAAAQRALALSRADYQQHQNIETSAPSLTVEWRGVEV